jgi:membrane protein required for colicin V production
MKILDIIILVAIIWFAFKGLKAGFVDGIFSILALIIGGWATVRFTDYTCQFFGWDSETKRLLATGITFIAAVVLVFFVGKLCKSIVRIVLPEFVDKLLGLVLGGGKVLLCAGILFYLTANIDVNEKILTPERKQASFFYTPSLKVAQFLLPQFEKIKEKKSN